MSLESIRIIIAASLVLHSIAHGSALIAAIAQSLSGAVPSRVPLHSWLFPSLLPKGAAALGLPFWGVSTLCFLLASLSFWAIPSWGGAWRHLALAGSIVSILGTVLFSATWPGSPNPRRSLLNTLVALAMNGAILATLLWLHWPPQAMFGN
jgi:hypothetical protein